MYRAFDTDGIILGSILLKGQTLSFVNSFSCLVGLVPKYILASAVANVKDSFASLYKYFYALTFPICVHICRYQVNLCLCVPYFV